MNVFELEEVHFSYDGIDALKDITLSIEEEGLVILGANGSGKSTLLSLLDCLIFPQRGRLKVGGQDIDESSFSDKNFSQCFRSRIGFMFQNPDVQLFCSTVEEEIGFAPLQLGLPHEEIEGRVSDTLKMVGIEHLRDRSPHTLSGGEKKKVALASLLSFSPQVLLLDEPTSNLDPRTSAWLADLLCELAYEGKTIIMATHDLEIAESVSRNAVIIGENHRILAEGKTEEILADRRLLTDANLIHEHVHSHGESSHVHSHGHFRDHVHDHERGIREDALKEKLNSHIADCFSHTHQMRQLAKDIPESKFMPEIERIEKSLGRMAENAQKRMRKG